MSKSYRKIVFLTSLLLSLILAKTALASPIVLNLNQQKSKGIIKINSTILNTTASIKNLEGKLTLLDPKNMEVFISASGNDIELQQLPFDQMLLLSGLIKTVMQNKATFQSTSIDKNGTEYIINGIATAGKNRNKVTIPAIITKSNNTTIFNVNYSRNGVIGGDDNQIGQMFGEVKTNSKLSLVFE
jgi:hypothetical protein